MSNVRLHYEGLWPPPVKLPKGVDFYLGVRRPWRNELWRCKAGKLSRRAFEADSQKLGQLGIDWGCGGHATLFLAILLANEVLPRKQALDVSRAFAERFLVNIHEPLWIASKTRLRQEAIAALDDMTPEDEMVWVNWLNEHGDQPNRGRG